MVISASKSKAMVLSRKGVECLLRVVKNMWTSLLRIGHLRCVNKCLQTQSWNILSRPPPALTFSTKSSGSKTSSKKPSKESAPDPFVNVVLVDGALNLIQEAVPNKVFMEPVEEIPPPEGSLKSVVEGAQSEALLEPLTEEVSLEPVLEVADADASCKSLAEATPEELSLEPVVEVAPMEVSLELVVKVAPEEASLEPVVEAAPTESSPKLATEVTLTTVSDGVPETLTADLPASLEPVAKAVPEPVAEATPSELDHAESMPEPEAEVVLEPVAEITESTDVVPGSEDLVDPALVLSKAAEEELQMESPAEAVGPSQGGQT
ncbi:hypothetical protein CCH79_00018648 [Gambusia affinis]|uniref:Uncharacterized protein n=1 Tax=Gambusia affinis TaxID=33528 RepID=A0A315V6U4_GAMAF|nr:hypothetical protein CCH79_00018648 [Gambusia affinis]